MLNSSFMIPMRQESETMNISRTSVFEAPNGRAKAETALEKADKPKGPTFQELLSQVKETQEQKSEAKAGPEETGKNEKVSQKQFPKSDNTVEANQQVKDETVIAAKSGSAPVSVKDKLIKEILLFLEQNKETVKLLKNGTDLPKGKVELESKSQNELKDLLDKLKSDISLIFQARILMSEHKDSKVKAQDLPKDESKSVSSLSDKDNAFKVEEGKDGSKIFVNKDKVQVVDKRTSSESQDQGAKSLTESQKNGTGVDDALKKDSSTLSRTESSGFKDLMEKREIQEVSAKNLAKEVRETNKIFHDVVQQSKVMIQDRKTSMQLDLKPENLGRVTLKIEVVDNKVIATIYAQNEGTGDMFRQNMQNMQNAFKDAGLNLQGLAVNVGTSDREFQDMLGEHEQVAEKSLSNNPDAADDDIEGLSTATVNYGMARWVGFQTVDYIV